MSDMMIKTNPPLIPMSISELYSGQEISCFYGPKKLHHHSHKKWSLLDPILRHFNLVHIFTTYFSYNPFSIFLLLYLDLPKQNLCLFSHTP